MDTSFTWNVSTTRVVRVKFAPSGQDVIELNVTEENAENVAQELEQVAAAIRSSVAGSMLSRPSVTVYGRPAPLPPDFGALLPAAPYGGWVASAEEPR